MSEMLIMALIVGVVSFLTGVLVGSGAGKRGGRR